MRFCQTQFPRQTGMLYAGFWGSTCTAVVTGDQDDIRLTFSNTRRDSADTDFGYQLDVDPRAFIGVFQVVNEL